MKRILVLLTAAILMSGCIAVKNNEGGENRASKTFYVSTNDWDYIDNNDGSNGFFLSEQSWTRLEPSLLGKAVIVAYYIDGNGRYQQLPYEIYLEGTDNNGNPIYWQEKIDYDFKAGNITFYVTNSDFYNQYSPNSMEFRVVMMW